jgi:fibrillarin-like pre-rRNA processing protein
MRVEKLFDGVYRIDRKIATINSDPNVKVYNEELIKNDGIEYRSWNPYRSKLAAAILNGLKTFSINEKTNVLYLGAATGTTASHVSDIAHNGNVFCVELSERNMRELMHLCERRKNMFPILCDANNIDFYINDVGMCDVIYQDISAKEQALIINKNSRMLKKNGYAYFIIKSQSIDISKSPKEVFEHELSLLSDEFEVLEKIDLEPYDSMHLFVVLRKKA